MHSFGTPLMKYLALACLLACTACAAESDTPPDNEASSSVDAASELPIRVEGMEDMNEETAEEIIGSINPLENDLRGLEVAIRQHQGFLIKEDGAFFQLGVTDGEGVVRLDEEFTLVETLGVVTPTLAEAQKDEFYLRTYRLDEADYERMQASDLILQELKRTSPGENQLKFNAGSKSCANPALTPPDEYRFAMWVRTAPDVDFVPLSAGDVVMSRENAGPLAIVWEPCAD